MLLPVIDSDAEGLKYVPLAKTRLKLFEEQRKRDGLPFIHRRVFAADGVTVDVTASAFAPKIRIRASPDVVSAALFDYTVGAERFTSVAWFSATGNLRRKVDLPSVTTTTTRLLLDATASAAVVLEQDSAAPSTMVVRFVTLSVETYVLTAATSGLPAGATFDLGMSTASARASASLGRVAFAVCRTKDFANRTTSFTYAVLAPSVSGSSFSLNTVAAFAEDTGTGALFVEASDEFDSVYVWPGACTITTELDLPVTRISSSAVTHDVVRLAGALVYPQRRYVCGRLAASGTSYAVSYYLAGQYPSLSVAPGTDRAGFLRAVVDGAQVMELSTVTATDPFAQPSLSIDSFRGAEFTFTARTYSLPPFSTEVEALTSGVYRFGATEYARPYHSVSPSGSAILFYDAGALKYEVSGSVFSLFGLFSSACFFSATRDDVLYRTATETSSFKVYRSVLTKDESDAPLGFFSETAVAEIPNTLAPVSVGGVDYTPTRGARFVIPLARELHW